MNRSLFFVFFSILASLSLITGCAEKPAENTERVNKVELTDYQNSFAAAEKNLYQNGLNIHVSYENKKMSGINIIPTDFSRRAGERIQSLEKYISFIDEALSKYVGKKVKFEGDYESIITDEEKNILNQSKLEAQKLIKHYQSVLRYQNNEDFLHHDEYEDLVGDYLKKAKKTLADLEKKKGVVFSPPYIDKNIILSKDTLVSYLQVATAPSIASGIGSTLKGLVEETREALEKLEGKIVVADVLSFHDYHVDQLDTLETLNKDREDQERALKDYLEDLKEIEAQLLENAGLKALPSNDIEKFKKVEFHSDIEKRYTDSQKKIKALRDYNQSLKEFYSRHSGGPRYWTEGEQARILNKERGMISASKTWIRFYEKRRFDQFLNFSQEKMLHYEEWQSNLESYASERGVDLANLPVSSLKVSEKKNDEAEVGPAAWFFNHPLKKFDFKLKSPHPHVDLAEGLYATMCFLRSVHKEILGFMGQSLKIEFQPGQFIEYTDKHRQRSLNAIEKIGQALVELGKSPDEGPCLDLRSSKDKDEKK